MTSTSPRRGIATATAALVSALLLMPSGTALAHEHGTPHTTDDETHTTLPSEPAVKEEAVQDDAMELPEPAETQMPSVDSSQSPSPQGLEPSQSKAPETTNETTELPAPEALLDAQTNNSESLTCEPGDVYSIRSNGDVYQVGPGDNRIGDTDRVGKMGGGRSEYNGIGIGANGGPVYAYQRTQNYFGYTTSARIMRWEGSRAPGEEVTSTSINLDGSLVAGAVDLNTGNYYFGGYETTGLWPNTGEYRFKIWRYIESSDAVEYVGYVNTGIQARLMSAANGDMAFNTSGDLFFLVSGGTRAAIGTVGADELSNANGGELQSSSTELKTLAGGSGGGDANGIAFDPDGSIYLGTTNYLYKYNPTTWEQIGVRRNVLQDSTDLAGCSSPSSIEITKNIVDRKEDPDQFTLWMKRGPVEVAQATTVGSAKGQQDEQIGPVVAIRGETYTISEVMAEGATSNLNTDYETTWVCTDEEGWKDSGEGTEFEVTVTKPGQTISCEFTNTPVPDTQLTLRKEFDTSYGAPEDTEDWTLTATPNGGKAIEFDHGQTKNVEAGQYRIAELFGDGKVPPGAAGYELADITCTTDGENNPVRNSLITLKDRTATECVLTNTDLPGAVVWEKTNANGTPLADSEWLLTGPNGFGELAVVDNGQYDVDKTVGKIRVEGLHWGDYTLEEIKAPAGFELSSDNAEFTITGAALEYTFDEAFINKPLQPGTLPLTGTFSGKWPLIGAAGLALAVLTGLAGTLRRRNSN